MRFLSFFLPFWYPLLPNTEICMYKPSKAQIFSTPLVVYQNKNKNFTVHSDICPHQGASLSEGKLTCDRFLQCPYHGFEFNDGTFCRIPNPENPKSRPFKSRVQLPLFPCTQSKEMLFVCQNKTGLVDDTIFYPPEEYNSDFRGVDGYTKISSNYLTVCENLLDMLHISYVHSFGSVETPLPFSMNFTWCSPYHGKSTFLYKPHKNTISQKIGKVNTVKVENEFILPTNTITRVFAGKSIKTVFTRTIPISDTESILYWKIYRNFWTFPLGDALIEYLMKKTIQEDLWILKRLYTKNREGQIRTKYDKTIQEFRNSIKKYL